ncbi:MAG TPA: phosphatase PAP2 family protein [Gaiellaceae bacterium]|jgi:undecaprenyl-diphosphatase|nr:phosphatase PAP2 family protein [Gaiellaceae bacterium]
MPARVARFVNVLGLELVGGIVVLTLGAWIFGLTVEELSEGDTHLDTRFAAWLHEHATEGWTTFFENVTRLGNVPVLAAVTLVAAIVLARKRLTSELELLLLAAFGTQILTFGLKLGFERERPFFPDPLATESTYSFPSGHASVSLAVYGTIGYIAARHATTRGRQIGILVAAAGLILLIGFSRLYLGVHYLSDVIAGFSLGLAWVALCVVLLQLRLRLRTRRERSFQNER